MFQHAFSGIGNPFWHNDVQALKSLLNTPQPSGKLAHWGMALKIEHQSGKHNANADALSRRPLPESTDSIPEDRVVAQLSVGEEVIEPEPGEWGSCPPEDGCRIEATDWLPWDKSTSTQQEGCKMNSAGQCAIYPWGQCPLQGGRRWNTMGGSPSGSKKVSLSGSSRREVWGSPWQHQGLQWASEALLVGGDAVRHHSVDQGVCHLCYPECGESCEATNSNSSRRALR